MKLSTSEEVLERVRPIVDRHQPPGYRFVVRDAWFSKGLEAWVIAVDSEPEEISAFDFAKRLVDLEEFIQQEVGKDVHVQPGMYRED